MDAKSLLRALAACGLLALSGCGTVGAPVGEPARTYLSQEELKALLSQTRTVRITSGNVKAMGVFTRDGIANLDWGSGTAKGTWRIAGKNFCTKYPGVRRGYETCYSIEKNRENVYTLHDDSTGMSGTWVIEK